jgi:ribosome-associated heat shock protein Hsp15
MSSIEATRGDAWLWAVRVFKTRSQATAACRGGHVRVNGATAKPASPVRPGDRVETRLDHRDRVLEVVETISKRVGPPIAAQCYVDHSPPPPKDDDLPFFLRDRGAGRPTKRDRRRLDRVRRY